MLFGRERDGADWNVQVTIEIDSNPPEMPNPSGLDLPTDMTEFKGNIHRQFELPASLLE